MKSLNQSFRLEISSGVHTHSVLDWVAAPEYLEGHLQSPLNHARLAQAGTAADSKEVAQAGVTGVTDSRPSVAEAP